MKIAIIGAGIGGMAAAYDLVKAGHTVTIYKSADYVGGLAAGFKEPNWDWSVERFYHHWFASDKHILGLIDELGWQSKVQFRRPFTVMYHQGKFYPFDSIFTNIPLFLLRHYPLIDVIRFGFVGLYLRLTNNWKPLEKSTTEAWMRKWAGDRIFEMMWQPMLIGKFGERYAKMVNMAWMWARLKSRTTNLGTFEGGFQAFADTLAGRLRELGVEICLTTPVNGLTQAPEGGLDLSTSEALIHYDQVLVTTSPTLLARIAPTLPPD